MQQQAKFKFNRAAGEFFVRGRQNAVSYNLDDLFAKPPSERLIVPDDNPHRPVVHLARWPANFFATHGEFVQMTELYDSAMQGFLQGMSPDDLAEWFIPHDDDDKSAPPPIVSPSRTEDAVAWLNRNYPLIRLPWLNPADHTEIISETDAAFGDLIAYGKAGYLYVFAADLLW